MQRSEKRAKRREPKDDDESSVSSLTTQHKGKDGGHIGALRNDRKGMRQIVTLLKKYRLPLSGKAENPYQEFLNQIKDGLVDANNEADFKLLKTTAANEAVKTPHTKLKPHIKEAKKRFPVNFSDAVECRGTEKNVSWVEEISDVQNGKKYRKEDAEGKWEKLKAKRAGKGQHL